MSRKTSSPTLHPKWLVLIVLLLIGYGLLQPVLNSRLGWSLPSLTSLLTGDSTTQKADPKTVEDKKAQNNAEPKSQQPNKSSNSRSAASKSSARSTRADPSSKSGDEDLLYGILRETRRDEYVSPAGLRYARGSEEGHRLEHLARHLADQPDRPGRHGVFLGDMAQVLLWLDEAYIRAKQRAKGTKTRMEDGRTVIEVSFTQPIGYIGGRDGGKQRHPESKRLRMVLDGDRVITAFPI